MTALIQAEAIGRRDSEGRWLLRDLSVEIRTADRIAIRGPSGAGKTLLLRALALLDPLESGEILWRGERVPDHDVPAYRHQIGYLSQSPALVEGTALENLRLPFTLGVHRNRAFDLDRALELLQQLGSGRSLLARSSGDLSGGEGQILALVRLLQLDPVVLLLDEPTASLDPEATRRARDLINDWAESGQGERALVWVSHDEKLARRVSSRRLRLEGGSLIEEDTS